jgi:hypothetical protein
VLLIMQRVRRTMAMLLVAFAIGTGSVAVTACGAVSHAVGGVAVHSILNHLTRGHPGAQRLVSKGFCLYHGHRILVDVRHHHYFAAGLNALAAARACRNGFFR